MGRQEQDPDDPRQRDRLVDPVVGIKPTARLTSIMPGPFSRDLHLKAYQS